jgi:hypothetical protein
MIGEGRIRKDLEASIDRGTEENHENTIEDSRSTGQDLNPGPYEYEARLLTTQPRRSITYLFKSVYFICNDDCNWSLYLFSGEYVDVTPGLKLISEIEFQLKCVSKTFCEIRWWLTPSHIESEI